MENDICMCVSFVENSDDVVQGELYQGAGSALIERNVHGEPVRGTRARDYWSGLCVQVPDYLQSEQVSVVGTVVGY